MKTVMEQKTSFWEIPWPMYFVYPFKKLYQAITKGKHPKPLEPRTRLIVSGVLILISLIAIWVLQGFVNPIRMFIDDMFFLEPSDTLTASEQGSMYGLYMIVNGFIVMIAMKLIGYFIYGSEEHPFWTVDGISLVLVSVALALTVDSILKRVGFEEWVYPLLKGPQYTDNPFDIDTSFFIPAIICGVLLFFVSHDVATTVLSINLTLLLIGNVPELGNFGRSTLSCIILVVAVNIAVSLLDRIGVVKAVCGFIIRWVYTLKYYFMLWFPPLLIIYIVKKCKKNNEQPR